MTTRAPAGATRGRLARLGLLLGGLLLLALPAAAVAGLVAAAPTASVPSPTAYASGGQNLTLAREAIEAAGYPVSSLVGDLRGAPHDALLLVPDATRALPAAELQALDDHLLAGGSVWVAGGTALASWLAGHGASMGDQHLLQLGSSEPGRVELTAQVGTISFPRVASLLPGTLLLQDGKGWLPWLQAPATAHLDLDANGTIGQTDPPGPFPVGALLALPSGGTLVASSDATLLGDDSWSSTGSDNAAAVRALLARLHPARIVVDETEHGWTKAEGPWVVAVRSAQAVAGLPLAAQAGLAAIVAAAGAMLALASRPLRPYAPHQPSDPVQPLPPLEPAALQDIAWDLLAERTGRPMAELRAAGPEAARGLADDPALRRVLLGRATSSDRSAILQAYLDSQGRDPA